MWPWIDLLLVLGLTLRLTRLIIKDDIGKWYIKGPAHRWHNRGKTTENRLHRMQLTSGLDCPFCVGFWIGVLVLLSLLTVGGPGHAAEWWRWAAGVFTLNWVVGHIATRAGDVD